MSYNSRDIHRLNIKQRLKLHLTTRIFHPGEEAVQFSTSALSDTLETMTTRDGFPFPTWTHHRGDNPPPYTDADRKAVSLAGHSLAPSLISTTSKNHNHGDGP